MSDVLTVDSVVKQFSSVRSVDRVSFSVGDGDILGFLGPNGAGKTTTIRMIMGITAPDEGRITFHLDGKSLASPPKSLIGYLPEERGLYRDASVLDILLFLAALKGIKGRAARQRALDWLERFDLAQHAKSKVTQLSKGMAQKVQFIAAVLHEPRLVVLDEPFSGLDPVNQDRFKAEIRQLAASGCAVLLSSHQMNVVEELCERIFLIHKGKRVVYGPLHEIKADYGVHRVQLVSSVAGWSLPSSPLVESAVQDERRWTITLRPGVEPMQFLSQLGPDAPIEEISATRISLHDIFVRVASGEEPA